MKQHIIPNNIEDIEPLTYAALEEEQLGLWLSDDDDNDDYDNDDGDNDDFDEYHAHNAGNAVTLSDDDEPMVLDSIQLPREDVEEHQAVLDGLLQNYLRAWDQLVQFTREQQQRRENRAAREQEDMSFDQFMDYNEDAEEENTFSDQFFENNAAGEEETTFSDQFFENNDAGEEENTFSDQILENNEAGVENIYLESFRKQEEFIKQMVAYVKAERERAAAESNPEA